MLKKLWNTTASMAGLIFIFVGSFMIASYFLFVRNMLGSSVLLTLCFLVLPLACVLIGIYGIVQGYHEIKRHDEVLTRGDRIMAVIDSIDMDYSTTVNGRPMLRIVAKDTNDRVYVSEQIKSYNLDYLIGQEIPVYVDRDDPENYAVEVSAVLHK